MFCAYARKYIDVEQAATCRVSLKVREDGTTNESNLQERVPVGNYAKSGLSLASICGAAMPLPKPLVAYEER
jgi:hypothetical protein